MIIPSIDLMGGKAVQLRQGREKVMEKEDVLQLAKEFSKYGEIAVVDLDAALEKGSNMELIKKICKIADCRVGGGIRSLEKANELLQAGAKKIIIGTKATPEFLKKIAKENIIVAVDVRDGFVVNKGWTEKTNKRPEEVIKKLESYCSEFLFTNVNKEGMMQGLDFDIVEKLRNSTKNKLTIAGGITTIDDIKRLEDLGVNSQIGMAIYTGKINLSEAFVSLLDFGKGLISTIVQDEKGQVLMLAYSSRESLLETFNTGKAAYFSRSRSKLWTKGETSGNFQEILNIKYDCDKDALLLTAKQRNFACHSGSYSCFGNKEFGLNELYDVISDRIKNPKKDSYTSRIAKDENEIKKKIREESEEVLNYKDRANLVWEIADLTYFILVLMAKKGITLDEIRNELDRRRK